MRLACQESLIPGSSLAEKWARAQSYGFDALELHGHDVVRIREQRSEWRTAQRAGLVVSTICLAGPPFIGDFDAAKRRLAVERLKLLLDCAAELGARGVVTPAAYGLFSKSLPPFAPPRRAEDDRAVLLEGLTDAGSHAQAAGSKVFLEPLNRYGDHMVNTLGAALGYAEAVGLESVQVVADTFHMNIEEADPPDAIRRAGARLGHVHIGDSNRLEAGGGHIDFGAIGRALRDIGYTGFLAFEHTLSGEASAVLPRAVGVVRAAMGEQP